MNQDEKLLFEAYDNVRKQVQKEAVRKGDIPAFSRVRKHFRKGDIVKLPIGWQHDRGYFADWAQAITHGRVWGHVIDRNIHMTGDVEVTLIDPYTREDLGQGLAFRPDELTLESSE